MAILLYIIIVFSVFSLLCRVLEWLLCKRRDSLIRSGNHEPKQELPYVKEKVWEPSYKLKHHGARFFHLPFIPEDNEIFYLENEYDEKANAFILKYKTLISEKFESKGFRFVYLPDIKLTSRQLQDSLLYHNPNVTADELQQMLLDVQKPLSSSFLLDYMVCPKNRHNIKASFAYFNTTSSDYSDGFRRQKTIFDYISFDGDEALLHPEGVLDEILEEIGEKNNWSGGVNCMVKRNVEKESPDDRFDYDIKQLLEEVREKVAELRLRGISESVITRYMKPVPELSKLIVTYDMRILLEDYDKEVVMQPINKTVFLLFLRHPEGLFFKRLCEHANELAVIYHCVKEKKNNIEQMLSVNQKVPTSILAIVDPLSNSVNEKCTRIKENFLLLVHDDIAKQYYITGQKGDVKSIKLPRHLVVWKTKE